MHFTFKMLKLACAVVVVGAALLMARPARADSIDWAYWSNTFTPNAVSGSATATLPLSSNSVIYTGEVESVVADYPSWLPASSYVGGTIGNAPPVGGGIVQLFGGNGAVTDTVTFTTPVTDPVMAIWSLGQSGINAQFDFTKSEPFAIEAGGPSAEYGGSSITTLGDGNVYGVEVNGTIQFSGTYSSLSWTNPVYEDWYGFTVGAPVPLPGVIPAFGVCMAAVLGWHVTKSARQNQNAQA